MSSLRSVVMVTLLAGALAASCARESSTPSGGVGAFVISGGTIYTLDGAHPRASIAVAQSGRFTCVGSRETDCAIPPGARVLDLKGGTVIPGLADAHGHVAALGRSLHEVDLGDCSSEDDCVARLAARAHATPPGAWVIGHGWNQTRWPGGRFPSHAALSRAVPDHPVFASRVDGHAAWVNARAMSLASIGAGTRDPAGGRIERDSTGAPTGVFVDNAQGLVAAVLPAETDTELRSALTDGLHALVGVGLTSVHDASVDARTLDVYADLARQDALPLRVYAMIDGTQPMDVLQAQMRRWRETPALGRLTVRAVKLFADGALGSRGAWLKEPYSDDPGNVGLAVTAPDELRRRIDAVARAGYQPCVHAIGDRACAETLADFVAIANVAPGLRPRVEHLQILDPADVHLLTEAGAVASMQPTHATSDGPWVEARLGHATDRLRGAYAWRTVLDAHVPLACGSDFPVEGFDPRRGLFSAETRRWPGGPEGGWMPEQRLTREEALRCFTSGAAYAEHAEARRGVIAVGYDADVTAFAGDVMAVPADGLPSLKILATVVAGRVEAGP